MRRSPLTEEDKGAEWSQKGPRNLCRESYWLAEASTGPTLLNESGNPSKGKAVFPKGQNGLSGPLTDFLLFLFSAFDFSVKCKNSLSALNSEEFFLFFSK